MKKEQKEILQSQLNNEKKTINELKQVYGQALKDVNEKIRELSSRTDMENLQSIIYQKQYQEALKVQLEGVLANLQSNEYATVSEYLTRCYQEGYAGVAYELKSQGIPMIIPIDQSQVVKAIQTDSKISNGLYTRLGEDVKKLKTSIRAELSRGIANGSTWNEIATRISGSMKNSLFQTAMNNSIRIARTEGHRVQVSAAMDFQSSAKEKGADVVKQWDATLDGATRDSHRELDGKLAEVYEDFEYSGGTVSAPGMFGDPAEDCNCRCALLTRARWALDEEELKTLQDRASYFGLDKTKDFDDFKGKYLKSCESIEKNPQSSTIKSKGMLTLDLQFFSEKDIERQESNSLKRAIRKYENNIVKHEEKIANPEKYIPNWSDKDIREKEGLKRHWQKEIRNFKQSINDRVEELKKRGDYDE